MTERATAPQEEARPTQPQLKTLKGLRVVVTRPAERGNVLVDRLSQLGAQALAVPTITFQPPEDQRPLDYALLHAAKYEWIVFTSATAVQFCLERLGTLSCNIAALDAPLLSAVGPATGKALRANGLAVELVPRVHTGSGLLAEMAPMVAGKRVLLPRSDIADPGLPAGLRRAGAIVDEVIAYRTVPSPDLQQNARAALAAGVDLICFNSPSAVHAFMSATSTESHRRGMARKPSSDSSWLAAIAQGPATGKAAREAGLRLVAETSDSSVASLLDAIRHWWTHGTGGDDGQHA